MASYLDASRRFYNSPDSHFHESLTRAGVDLRGPVDQWRADNDTDNDLALVIEWAGSIPHVDRATVRTTSRASMRAMAPTTSSAEEWDGDHVGFAPALVDPPVFGRRVLWMLVGGRAPEARSESN
jgi:hypothetical protein